MLLFFIANSFAEETKGTTVLPFDSHWSFWAGSTQPTQWPIALTPKTKDARTLVPKEIADSPDRWAYIQKESTFTTQGMWWEGFLAPFSIRNNFFFELA